MDHPELAALMKGMASFPIIARKEGRLGELYAVWRNMLRQVIEHGQARGEVRTDLPTPLLVEVSVAMDEAFDMWLFDHMDELGENAQEKVVGMILDFWKRMLAP